MQKTLDVMRTKWLVFNCLPQVNPWCGLEELSLTNSLTLLSSLKELFPIYNSGPTKLSLKLSVSTDAVQLALHAFAPCLSLWALTSWQPAS